jgi:hypothetical protein
MQSLGERAREKSEETVLRDAKMLKEGISAKDPLLRERLSTHQCPTPREPPFNT